VAPGNLEFIAVNRMIIHTGEDMTAINCSDERYDKTGRVGDRGKRPLGRRNA